MSMSEKFGNSFENKKDDESESYFSKKSREFIKNRENLDVIYNGNKTGNLYFRSFNYIGTKEPGVLKPFSQVDMTFYTEDFPENLRGVTDGNLAESKPQDGKIGKLLRDIDFPAIIKYHSDKPNDKAKEEDIKFETWGYGSSHLTNIDDNDVAKLKARETIGYDALKVVSLLYGKINKEESLLSVMVDTKDIDDQDFKKLIKANLLEQGFIKVETDSKDGDEILEKQIISIGDQ